MPGKRYHVYMMSNKYNNVLYIGITGDLQTRVWEHKQHKFKGFTSKYNVEKLVYYEPFGDINEAIAFEKEIKKWRRDWKSRLVNERNPLWEDLWDEVNVL